jgi:hypothetical protein
VGSRLPLPLLLLLLLCFVTSHIDGYQHLTCMLVACPSGQACTGVVVVRCAAAEAAAAAFFRGALRRGVRVAECSQLSQSMCTLDGRNA